MTRTTCPHDKRAYLVGLTEQGRQVIEHALPLHIAKVEETFSVLTEDEQAELIRLLKNSNLVSKIIYKIKNKAYNDSI